MIDQIDKKLSGVVIPDTPLANKSCRIQTLDKAFEISFFDGEDLKVKAIKTVASWRAPQRSYFRPSFPNQTLTEQPIVV